MVNKKFPFVSVIVPHKGPDDSLVACLQALRKQTYPKDSFEVIVVRNEAEDTPPPLDVEAHETFLWQPEGYSYAARNLGIKNSSGSIVAFTDSDAAAEKTWIEEGVRSLGLGAEVVAGRVELTFTKSPLTPAACYEKLFAFDQEKNVSLGRAATVNLFVRKEIFRKLGLFDENAESGEDFRWTFEAHRIGAAISYSALATVRHPARQSIQKLLCKARRVASNFAPVNKKAGLVGGALNRYCTLYVIPPSLSRRESCTSRERALAHVVALVVQSAKAAYFVRALLGSRRARVST